MKLKAEENKYTKFSTTELGENLARLTRVIEDKRMSLLVIVDGWESSGRGKVIKNITKELNPKHYDVEVFDIPNKEESKYPFAHRFWSRLPKYGDIKIFDRSFYYELMENLKITDKKLKEKIEHISEIEKILYDDNTVIVKLFLDISENIQKDRIKDLENSKLKSFYVTSDDKNQSKKYDKFREHFKNIIELTNFENSKWHIIDAEDGKEASKQALGIIAEELTVGIERDSKKREDGAILNRAYKPTNKPLDNIDLSKELSQVDYDEQIEKLQEEAADLMLEFYNKEIPSMLVFEGMDAAGKDGGIERLVKYMDPRLYKVHAISAPDETENSYNYLWRFYNRMPENGKMGIFSRSWYGRVMVERIEGFAKDVEWERAYDEILKFENQFYRHGGFVMKFFVAIDKDEQLTRFKAREEDPDKQYKITDEDWRNRDKWDDYLIAMNEMLDRTDSDFAPWIIVEGNDKKYSRIKILKEFIKYAKERLKNN